MGFEMEFCKTSRRALIFIAEIVCVMLEKHPVYSQCPVSGVNIWQLISYSFFLLKSLEKDYCFLLRKSCRLISK